MAEEKQGEGWPYGPYYRIQAVELNEEMEQTGRVGGKALRNIYAGAHPKVKAYIGHLPAGKTGIEFFTNVPPDTNTPPGLAQWSQGNPGVLDLPSDPMDGEEVVAIPAKIVKRVEHATR